MHKERGWEPRCGSDGSGAAGPGQLLPSSRSALSDKLGVPHPCWHPRPGWMRSAPLPAAQGREQMTFEVPSNTAVL